MTLYEIFQCLERAIGQLEATERELRGTPTPPSSKPILRAVDEAIVNLLTAQRLTLTAAYDEGELTYTWRRPPQPIEPSF